MEEGEEEEELVSDKFTLNTREMVFQLKDCFSIGEIRRSLVVPYELTQS